MIAPPAAPIALPLVPATSLGATGVAGITTTTGDQVSWPAYVREVAKAYAALPATDRARTAVIAGHYGEAGALAKYGPADGLPATVYSGPNQLYLYARHRPPTMSRSSSASTP